MSNRLGAFKYGPRAICRRVLQFDNAILGVLICIIAAYNWPSLYDALGSIMPLYSQGLYGLLVLTTLSASASAVYLTLAGLILLSLKQPKLRYTELTPNLIAIGAAFTAYIFPWIPRGALVHVNLLVALFLIASGNIMTMTSLLFMRRSFSVTPQVRSLVMSGPYAIVRHPMYVGNIVSLVGLVLLVDSVVAIGLGLLCVSLQIWRAAYEERLLQAGFAEYDDYQARVGGFIPRLRTKFVPTAPAAISRA